MSVRIQTIHGALESDSLRDAERIASNLRAAGAVVAIGVPYENVTVRRYGMVSVDLTITEPEPEPEPDAPTAA